MELTAIGWRVREANSPGFLIFHDLLLRTVASPSFSAAQPREVVIFFCAQPQMMYSQKDCRE